MASPFEPQAMDPAESPFSAVLPESSPREKIPEASADCSKSMESADDLSQVSPERRAPIEAPPEEDENPAGKFTSAETIPGESAKEWWPGDPSSSVVKKVTDTPSPFVAVGTPPEPSAFSDRTEGRAQSRTADSAASDREEVERMLKLLRERQDNH